MFTALYPPGLAWAQELTPIVTIADNIANVLTGDFARAIAVIGLAACGFLAFAGRMPWGAAIAVITGIVLVFGAATLVDEIADIASAGGDGG
jgi:type IV secretion system protein VirB2